MTLIRIYPVVLGRAFFSVPNRPLHQLLPVRRWRIPRPTTITFHIHHNRIFIQLHDTFFARVCLSSRFGSFSLFVKVAEIAYEFLVDALRVNVLEKYAHCLVLVGVRLDCTRSCVSGGRELVVFLMLVCNMEGGNENACGGMIFEVFFQSHFFIAVYQTASNRIQPHPVAQTVSVADSKKGLCSGHGKRRFTA